MGSVSEFDTHFALQPRFAERLKASDEEAAKALKELGIALTPELQDALKAISYDELVKMMTLLKAGAGGVLPLGFP